MIARLSLILGMLFCLLIETSLMAKEQKVGAPQAPAKTDTKQVKVQFINNSKTVSDGDIYILVKGNDPTPGANGAHSYLRFVNGVGSYNHVDPTTESKNFSYQLTQLQNVGESEYQFTCPPLTSGRIYISIRYPMELSVTPDKKINDPDGLNTNDPNYYTLFDKVEFTYTVPPSPPHVVPLSFTLPRADVPLLFINPTAVDFYCLPLYITVTPQFPSQPSFLGSNKGRKDVFSGVKQVFDEKDRTSQKIWTKLFVEFTDPVTKDVITHLRIASTGKAMTAAPPLFNPNYLSSPNLFGFDWMNFVWSTYYKNHSLSIDATELKDPPNNKIFTGYVNSENQFVFKAEGVPDVTINRPNNSAPFFEGAGDSFNATNNTPLAIIVRSLTAAFVTGILPVTVTPDKPLNKSYFKEHQPYYTDNVNLPQDARTKYGPWYDLYSMALHSIVPHMYTCAYDDALGIDGTIGVVPSDQTVATITLEDLTETTIPDPYTDKTEYTVQVGVAANNPVTYYKPPPSKEKISLRDGQTLENVSIPMTVELMRHDGQKHKVDIYIKYPIVKPPNPGIVITKPDPNKPTFVHMAFPGK